MVHDQLGAGLPIRVQRALRPHEPMLGLVEAPEPQQGHRAGGQAGDDDRIVAPAVRIGVPHRLVAELEPLGERHPGPRARDPEMTEGADLEPGAPGAACQRQRLLEVAPRVIQPRGPQLGDPEILQRDISKRVTERARACRLPCQRPLHQRHRLEDGSKVAAPAREHERHLGQEHVKARPTFLGTASTRRRARSRYAPLSSRSPSKRRAIAKTSASSASAAATSSGNTLSKSQTVPARPSRVRSRWLSASRREASGQSRAACACRIASTMSPSCSCPWAAARCSEPTMAGETRRSSSCSRSANRW